MRRPPVGTPAVASDGEELKALVGDEKSTADLAQEKKAKSQIVFAIVGYATCSSLMLIINKLSMHLLPAASFVLFLQLATCAVVVKVWPFYLLPEQTLTVSNCVGLRTLQTY